MAAIMGMGCLALALVLVVMGAAMGREGGAWMLPLVAVPLIAELVLLWQKNMEWMGTFLLTNDGILCESPLSAPVLLRWDEITDCCYIHGKGKEAGTYCFCSEKLKLTGEYKLPTAPASAKLVKISDRKDLQGALEEFLPGAMIQKLAVDRIVLK